jgi:ubiquinone/menaquinone biosynthesis C-methylase UbiE
MVTQEEVRSTVIGRSVQPLEKRLPRSKKPPEEHVAAFFHDYRTEFAPGDRCLELGVGEGRQLSVPARHRLELYGIDCDPLAIEILAGVVADRGIAIHATLGEITQLPYPDTHFRVAYATSVLQFLPDLRAAQRVFQEVARVLLSGGLFFIKINTNPKRENADRRRRLEYLAFHEIASLAEQAGLRFEKIAFEPQQDERRVDNIKLVWHIVFRKPA